MKNYLKKNLTVKLFLIVCISLISISLLICVLFAVLMPSSYIQLRDEEFNLETQKLLDEISLKTYEDAIKIIEDFSNEMNVYTEISTYDGEVIYVFGDILDNVEINITSEDKTIYGTSQTFELMDIMIENKSYLLSMSGASYETINEVYLVLAQTIPVIIIIALSLSFLISFFLSKYITKPIKDINLRAKKISMLNFDIYCDEKREDELGELSKTINLLSKKLDDALISLKRELLKAKALEESQRLFFAAASHELKTPLTIIKGNLEGMIYGYKQYEDKDKYIAKTLKTTNRMQHLINEILSVSLINDENYNLNYNEINIKEIIYDILKHYDELIQVKNFNIKTNLEDSIIFADEKMLIKVLSNIINNALYYSPENETIIMYVKGNTVKIKNTGVSLSNDDIKNLFEPFYRADKSRNKQTGGSGLGLYFVKLILEKHKFDFNIKSGEDSVEFTIIY